MRKISGQLVSSKPISLPLAAKRLSSFAALENGSAAAVSIYLQRAAEAFNQLVKFHDHNKPFTQSTRVKKKNPDREIEEKSTKEVKREEPIIYQENLKVDDAKLEKRKKKRKKSVEVDLKVEVKEEEMDDVKLGKKKKKRKKSNEVDLKVEVKNEEN